MKMCFYCGEMSSCLWVEVRVNGKLVVDKYVCERHIGHLAARVVEALRRSA
jgi:hypothetical protein